MKKLIVLISVFVFLLACNPNKQPAVENNSTSVLSIESQPFGISASGDSISEFTLTNKNGMTMKVINYGGVITQLKVPGKNGSFDDVVLGFDQLKHYEKDSPYFGAIIGRYGNRIAKGKFSIDDVSYDLAINNLGNHLHGGIDGFDNKVWEAKEIKEGNAVGVQFTYVSKDMEEGYPGNLSVTVAYRLTNLNEVKIYYIAETDKPTVINLTNHTYFNLTGNPTKSILNHQLQLFADQYLPIDSTLIPLGEYRNVEGTPFDFRELTKIGERIEDQDIQIKYGSGYDHNWIINREENDLILAAKLFEPVSGRMMSVFTSEPGIQFYAGNFLGSEPEGKGGIKYERRTGLCLETQHFPDSPNQLNFPSVRLNPGEAYHSATVYQFEIE